MRGYMLQIGRLLLAIVTCSAAIAQFVEAEPNDAKAQATLVACPADGATIVGSAALIAAAPSGAGSIDYYLIRTCPASDGIYRHRLYLRTLDGAPAHVVQIVGVPDPAAPTQSVVASSSAGTVPANFVQWYGVGASHDLFVRVYAQVAGSMSYELRYERTDVAPTPITRYWTPAPATFSSNSGPDGRALALFDSEFTLLAQSEVGAADTVTLTHALAPGIYYLAESLPHLVTGAPAAGIAFPHLDSLGPVVGIRALSSQDNSCCSAFPQDPFLVRWKRIQVTDAVRPCCFADGACSSVTAAECVAAGGRFQSVGELCVTGACPAPGACCLPDGGCTLVSPLFCDGYSLGVGSTCATSPCPAPRGCCLGCDCTVTSPLICTRDGGTALATGVACSQSACSNSACCFPDGACACLTPESCAFRGGTSQGAGAVCSNTVCLARCLGGDANCDNRINNFDVDPWIIGVLNAGAVVAPAGYLATGASAACWELRNCWGDVNGDRGWNGFDVDPFVVCIIAQPPPGSPCN